LAITIRYQNHIPSARAPWHSYNADGVYFITICTSGRETLLGEVVGGEVVLSAIGGTVREEWEKSFIIPVKLSCDAYVIMVNHRHAILRIEQPTNGIYDNVETHGRASLQIEQLNTGMAYRLPKSILSFMAEVKSADTKRINEYRHKPLLAVWQERFHDHIIRNNKEYQCIL
jgi:putative transposase